MTTAQSTSPVACGTVMMQVGQSLPEHIDVITETYSPGWRTIAGENGFALDRKLRLLGWNCFFFAGELKAVSFGSSGAGMLNAAVLKLLAKVRSLDFNSVEFTNIIQSRFLGIPYARVSGHACHIQPSSQLEGRDERNRQQK